MKRIIDMDKLTNLTTDMGNMLTYLMKAKAYCPKETSWYTEIEETIESVNKKFVLLQEIEDSLQPWGLLYDITEDEDEQPAEDDDWDIDWDDMELIESIIGEEEEA